MFPPCYPVQILVVHDLVLLLWALAALQQYNSQLYRNAAFRATRLPDGVPAQPRLRRLLREATVLHRCVWVGGWVGGYVIAHMAPAALVPPGT